MHVVNADAFAWLDETHDLYDFAVVDFPDPSNYSLGKLYTTAFYRAAGAPPAARRPVRRAEHVAALRAQVVLVRRRRRWKRRASTSPYHVYVPSFGEWGFVIGGRTPLPSADDLPVGSALLTLDTLPELFTFPPDMQRVPVEANHLNTQVLVRYYEQEWTGSNR